MRLTKIFNLEAIQKSSIVPIALALFVVVNLIFSYASWRWDLTSGRVHTLSAQTKKILKTLDDVVTIKLFISSDLPSRLLSLKTEAVDLIGEYKKQGRGRIVFKLKDPKKDEQASAEADSLGVPQLQLSQVAKDQYAVSSVYFGVSISYGTKTEIIPQATNLGSLEYDITSAIFKLTQKEPLRVGLVAAAQSAPREEDPLYSVKKILAQQFELDFIDASSSAKAKGIDKAVKTVVVFADGQTKYASEEGTMFQRYLAQKGKMIFVVDGITILENSFTSAPAGHDLFSFFEGYGLTLNRNYVLSQSSELASFTTGELGFITPYPFWVKTGNFPGQPAELAHVGQLVFPWVASVDIKKQPGAAVKTLVLSEDQSWIAPDVVGLSPQTITVPPKTEMKAQTLVVEVKTKEGGAFILIPSSRFINERLMARAPENIDAFVNLVNGYASGGALSGIRARAVTLRPLIAPPERIKDVIKYLMIFLLPGFFVVFGTVRLIRRRS